MFYSEVGFTNTFKNAYTGENLMNAKNVENVLNKLAVYNFTWKYIQMKRITVELRTHTGSKPYSCSDIENVSLYITKLRSHLWTHTGEKPYTCKECGRCFSQSLSVHANTHWWKTLFIPRMCKCFRLHIVHIACKGKLNHTLQKDLIPAQNVENVFQVQ